MTRKDFELIAETIKSFQDADAGLIDALARTFADRLRATNKQFNRDRFIRACGVTP
jgi:hypothetical protein